MSKEVVLGNGKHFKTQTKFKKHFRKMLHKYEQAGLVVVIDENDIEDLDGLLEIHCSYDRITKGLGKWTYCVDQSKDYPTRCFHIYVNGQKGNDFSFNKISQTTSFANLKIACKFFTKEAVKEKRNDLKNKQCFEDEYDLYHQNPKFSACVLSFVEKMNWVDSDIDSKLSGNDSNENAVKFLDKKDAEFFLKHYHETYKTDDQFKLKLS